MTKKEHDALQKFMNRTMDLQKIESEAFTALQDLATANGLPRYCSAQLNAEQLAHTPDAEKAERLYKQWLDANSKQDLLCDYGMMLAELNFWKKH